MQRASLVYPHQLFTPHPAVHPGQTVFLVEDPLFFGNDRHWPLRIHRHRLLLHRASMTRWAQSCPQPVILIPHQPHLSQTSSQLLESHLPLSLKSLELTDPHDDLLERRLRKWAAQRHIELTIHPSPQFLTPPQLLHHHTGPQRKRPFMASFYKDQRTHLGILVEPDLSPTGGRWSFDTDNRERFPDDGLTPRPISFPPPKEDTSLLNSHPNHPGPLDTFNYPLDRQDALRLLDDFLAHRLENFGTYEDAISRTHRILFHSVLTPALNIGLLTPGEIVNRTLQISDKAKTPLNSLEGFIRQIIGWREFIHGIYKYRGRDIRRLNFWNHHNPIPDAFYSGTTGIPPVDHVIRNVLRHSWCHHIERLMVLGNFMLLCRIHPDAVYRWFMELFVDAYDWVMVPNIYGMSQFADGGSFTTKPYISGSNYIRKMSHHPKGPWCDTWDSLFWSFIADHQDFFLSNPRLSMMAHTWRKLAPHKQKAHRENAAGFLKSLGLEL